MAKKYDYNKKHLRGLSVGKFLKQVKVRNEHIEAASADFDKHAIFNANKLAKLLHPEYQKAKIAHIKEWANAKSFYLVPTNKEKKLAFFRAGQYIAVNIELNGVVVSRPYSICSSPSLALADESTYILTIKKNQNGFTSKYVNENWKVGDELTISGPLGQFYYTGLRDSKHVVAIAGGSGITPFIAMANAIADNQEDFDLTIIYCNYDAETLLFKQELDDIVAKTNNKVKVIYVLDKDEVSWAKHGLITTDIVKEAMNNDLDTSLFVCGSKGLYSKTDEIAKDLDISIRRYRKELWGEYGNPSDDFAYPKECIGKEYNVKVRMRDKVYELKCKANQTLLNAMELNGVHAPSDCRSGECGWCHSLLLRGRVYIPGRVDGRRMADKTYSWIHPCISYPTEDVEIEVPYNK